MLIHCNFQYLMVCGLCFDEIWKSATTEKWSESISEIDTERRLRPEEPTMRLGQ